MKIVIAYNKPGSDALEDELDILHEVKLISDCLTDLGHESLELPVTLDLASAVQFLKMKSPDLVFNLTESLENHGAVVYFVPALLDVLRIPYTGNPTIPMFITASKVLTKKHLASEGIPITDSIKPSEARKLPPGKFIVKPIWEEGSLDLDEKNVFTIPGTDLSEIINLPEDLYFIEPFIEGREFNVSMLAGSEAPQVLAVAEILFIGFPEEKPKMLGYKAKWKEDSFEYVNTIRTYDLGLDTGNSLQKALAEISVKCWDTLGLRGYARVDFRMDIQGNLFVLEVNSNPCITPGSGYYAACEQAGITFTQAVDRIIKDALKK
ncbi:MAG TPA: ATP-grasp domain-containing protein [Bacteroidales bacterium]|nr:ATP-grasp domain-containing protein [Bacteroidales bacterium]HPR58260.1 ATP-grasp domain-containing protein [Bacteroidales bacterium]HRW96022.1 ATP-grasp domain-containing protein [Bacteroidales bacterium]